MRIYTDKYGTKYADIVVGGKRRRISLKTKDGKVAILRAGKLADDRQATNDGKVTLAAFLARYREFIKATKSKETCRIFETAIKKLVSFKQIGGLAEITPSLLDDLLIFLKNRGDGHSGINRSIRAIRTAYKQAELWQLAPHQDWTSVIKLREKKHRVEYHTIKELDVIFSLFQNDINGLVATALASQAGLRRSEAAFAKWEYAEFDQNRLYVPANKTDEFRFVPMTPLLREVLMWAKARTPGEYMINLPDTKRESKDYISSYYSYHTADLPFHCFYHKLRHTFASLLVQNGADLYYVSKLMGHASIKMTEKYAHLSQNNLITTMKLLPAPNGRVFGRVQTDK